MPIRNSVIAALALLCSATTLADTTIAWMPTTGSHYAFKWVATSEDYPGPSGTTSIRQEEIDHETIQKVDAEGNIFVELRVSNVKAMEGGEKVPASNTKEIVQTLTYRKDGLLINRHSTDPNDVQDPRIDEIERFVFPSQPVAVGSSWTYKSPADILKTDSHDAVTTFTYEGTEEVSGIRCYKIGIKFKEVGILLAVHAEGTAWVSADDGELVMKDVTAENLTVATGAHPFKLRMRKIRI